MIGCICLALLGIGVIKYTISVMDIILDKRMKNIIKQEKELYKRLNKMKRCLEGKNELAR